MASTPATPASSVTKATAAAPAGAGPQKPAAVQQAKRPPSFMIRPVAQREHFLKMLIYGNYGVGKTYLAGTASEVDLMKDVLLINAEAGDLTLQQFTDIDEVTVKDFKILARVYEWLKRHCEARDADDEEKIKELQELAFQQPVEGKPKRYRTVIVDSLSEVEQYCMNQLLGVVDTTRLDEDPMAAEFKEYKQNHTMILRLVRNFRNLPMHVIFTCAEAFLQDEMKRKLYSLDLTGKLSKKVQGFMDMVGYYTVGKKADDSGKRVRRLYVTPSEQGKFDAKHRYTKFKDTYFEDPTIGSILKATGLTDKEGAELKA